MQVPLEGELGRRTRKGHWFRLAGTPIIFKMRAARSVSLRFRSEERRVGKECRYWRDWSSDVCSSDLVSATGTVRSSRSKTSLSVIDCTLGLVMGGCKSL